MRAYSVASIILVLFAGTASAEAPLRLKNRAAERSSGSSIAGFDARRAPAHYIVEFSRQPRQQDLDAMESRGITPLRYIPDRGFLVSARAGTNLAGLPVARWQHFAAPDKISAFFAQPADGGASYVVELHPDANREAIVARLRERRLAVIERPDVLPHQILVSGDGGSIPEIAEWDEVAYLFPASRKLVEGDRVHACAGALTRHGYLAQYVLSAGDGWDGPGRGSAVLGYVLSGAFPLGNAGTVQAEIEKAFSEWARYADLTFVPVADESAARAINVRFAGGDHGDGFPFDGPGGVLAHTFFPAPPNPEPIAGDMHFDVSENWSGEGSIDFFSVVLHEAGHALGLAHSDDPASVMYPYYRDLSRLQTTDIAMIRALYASREPAVSEAPPQPSPQAPPQPAPPLRIVLSTPLHDAVSTTSGSLVIAGACEGGHGTVRLSWRNSRGASGEVHDARAWQILVPLLPGDNAITLDAADEEQSRASHTVVATRVVNSEMPELSITSPAAGAVYSTSDHSIVVMGTARNSEGISRVAWSNSRGGSGTAAGTTSWTAGPVPLAPGLNAITITAYAAGGAASSRTLSVELASRSADAQDTTAPSITITSPSLTTLSTADATIRISGTARDNTAVARVWWEDAMGANGAAQGTTFWNTADIPLREGTNTILIKAQDPAGNTAWRSLIVTRKKAAGN